jgi:hypothetical protein
MVAPPSAADLAEGWQSYCISNNACWEWLRL